MWYTKRQKQTVWDGETSKSGTITIKIVNVCKK